MDFPILADFKGNSLKDKMILARIVLNPKKEITIERGVNFGPCWVFFLFPGE
jgi:hypothetical protein